MTAELTTSNTDVDAAGASSHLVDDWHAINWQKVTSQVRRLQARIVKVTQEVEKPRPAKDVRKA